MAMPSIVLPELACPEPLPLDLNADNHFKAFRKTLTPASSDQLDAGLRLRALCKQNTPEACVAYIPFAFSLTHAFRVEMATRTFKWRSAFAKAKAESSCSGLAGYDFAMVHVQYAHLLHNQARTAMKAASTVEMFDTASRDASLLITKAAGILDYVREFVVPTLIRKPDLPPLELEVEFLQCLSTMYIANAQSLAIRKAMVKGTGMGLVAKLCMDVALRMEGITPYMQAAVKNFPGVLPLAQHAVAMGALYRMVAAKLLAKDHSSKDEYGLAESYITIAVDINNNSLKKIQKDLGPGPASLQYASVFAADTADLAELHQKFKKDNDVISMEKLKGADVLNWESKPMSKATPYTPPEPTFKEWKVKEADSCSIQ